MRRTKKNKEKQKRELEIVRGNRRKKQKRKMVGTSSGTVKKAIFGVNYCTWVK